MTDEMYCPRCEEWVDSETHSCFLAHRKKNAPEPKREPKIVLIEFNDVQRIDINEISMKRMPKDITSSEMVGFLVDEDEKTIYLAKQAWKAGPCRWVHAIPKKCITKKTILLWKDLNVTAYS